VLARKIAVIIRSRLALLVDSLWLKGASDFMALKVKWNGRADAGSPSWCLKAILNTVDTARIRSADTSVLLMLKCNTMGVRLACSSTRVTRPI
jgi:hypothetical protein